MYAKSEITPLPLTVRGIASKTQGIKTETNELFEKKISLKIASCHLTSLPFNFWWRISLSFTAECNTLTRHANLAFWMNCYKWCNCNNKLKQN